MVPRVGEAGILVGHGAVGLWDVLARWEFWVAGHGREGLTPEDRVLLAPRFLKLSRDAGSVSALSLDLVSELKTA